MSSFYGHSTFFKNKIKISLKNVFLKHRHKMSAEFLKFDDTKIEKQNFHTFKSFMTMKD